MSSINIVTGGAGFIGSHIVDKLVSLNKKVIVIDNLVNGNLNNIKNHIKKKKIKFINADLAIKGKWSNSFKNVDCIFHLAALADIVPSIENPVKYFESNIISTLNVVEAAKKFKVNKIVFSASSSCYGIPNKYPTNEKSIISTLYPYAFTKFISEQTLLHWGRVYNINIVSLRLFNVYGLRSRTSGTYGAVFGVFLAQKLSNKPFTVVGNGRQKRDFIYVDDVVNAFMSAAKSNIKNDFINIGSGKEYSINYLTKLLNGKKIYISKRPGEPQRTFADIKKAKKLLKWKPNVSFENGVAIILDNISYWKSAPVWNKKKISKATKNWFKYLN